MGHAGPITITFSTVSTHLDRVAGISSEVSQREGVGSDIDKVLFIIIEHNLPCCLRCTGFPMEDCRVSINIRSERVVGFTACRSHLNLYIIYGQIVIACEIAFILERDVTACRGIVEQYLLFGKSISSRAGIHPGKRSCIIRVRHITDMQYAISFANTLVPIGEGQLQILDILVELRQNRIQGRVIVGLEEQAVAGNNIIVEGGNKYLRKIIW